MNLRGVSTVDIKTDNEKIENGCIIITRVIDEMFTLPSFLKFNKEDKKRILDNLSAKLSRLSYTESSQKQDFEVAVKQLQIEQLKSILQNEKTSKILLNLMAYGKYIFDYQNNAARQEYYSGLFKENLKELQKAIGNEGMIKCLEHIAEANPDADFLRIIPLAYYEIVSHDIVLDSFRAGELMGHDVAYKVAKNEGKLKRLLVKDRSDRTLESYKITEIIVNRRDPSGSVSRDRGLMGSILAPEFSDDAIPEVPVIYVNWAGTHNTETLSSDFQRAAGEESYRSSEDQILNQIVSVIKEFATRYHKPVKIVFSGHSLGGAYSQLSYHSTQRILALGIQGADVQKKAQGLESNFQKELDNAALTFKLSEHLQPITGISLPPAMVRELSVDVWNSPGVLQLIEKHSNELSLLLTDKAGIAQGGNFGLVGGDVVQKSGQGSILSNAGLNKAKVNVMKIEPDTAGMVTSAVAPIGGGLAGMVIGPAILGLGTATGGFAFAGLTLAALLLSKYQAHTLKHFQNASRPHTSYKVFTSHNPDGSLNEDPETGYVKVREKLSNKSTLIIDSGISLISTGTSSSLRLQSGREYNDRRFATALQQAETTDSHQAEPNAVLSLLVTELGSATNGADERVLTVIKNKNLINIADKTGKTLLHHAIEKENFNLAARLLKIEGINVNMQDKSGNTAILMLMSKITYSLSPGNDAYQFGIALLDMPVDLSLQNSSGALVAKVFQTWRWNGITARDFSSALSRKLANPAANQVVNIK